MFKSIRAFCCGSNQEHKSDLKPQHSYAYDQSRRDTRIRLLELFSELEQSMRIQSIPVLQVAEQVI
jgi:hypothetical protein